MQMDFLISCGGSYEEKAELWHSVNLSVVPENSHLQEISDSLPYSRTSGSRRPLRNSHLPVLS